MTVFEKVLATVEKYGMLENKDRVLVAVSGGADSLALLHILLELKDPFKLSLHVFHLNHKMRGRAAETDARFVKNLARSLDLPSTVLSYDVPAYIKKHKLSKEEGARQVRYMLLEKVARDIKADKIALGHTADDQVETFLIRLIRGAGLEGLRAIPLVRGIFIRPLIGLSREETRQFCQVKGLKPRFDQSNIELSRIRNRIRHDLLPHLVKNYNTAFKEEVLREIELISVDVSLLEELTAKEWKRLATVSQKSVALNRSRLIKLPLALQRRLIREGIKVLKSDLREITSQHIEDVLEKVVGGQSGSHIELPGRLIVLREYDRILVEFKGIKKKETLPSGLEVPLKIPGETVISSLKLRIKAALSSKDRAPLPKDKNVACLDAEGAQLPLVLRRARAGDRFCPLGMKGSKKLQDFFVDEKIPRRQREQAVVIESAGRIIWVVGYRIADDFKVTKETERVLVLRSAYETGVLGGSGNR